MKLVIPRSAGAKHCHYDNQMYTGLSEMRTEYTYTRRKDLVIHVPLLHG